MNNQFYCQKQTLILECTAREGKYDYEFGTYGLWVDGNLTINYSHARLTHIHVLNTPNDSYQLKV